MLHDDSFRAMNTDVDVQVAAGERPLEAFLSLRLLFERQEARFSRFRPASLLCRLNGGAAVEDAAFAAACRRAIAAWEFTGGLFNPMVLPALREAGYAGSFETLSSGSPRAQSVPSPARALAISGDRVELREGELDLGGVVKGWTVDLAVEQLAGGFADALVNAGGDLRCAGAEPGEDGWRIAVAASGGEGQAWEGVMRGALATSTTARRRWRTTDGHEAHHLIDPRSGLPSASPFSQVSVWAEEAWVAECWAKAVLIGGPGVAPKAEAAVERVLAR